MVAARQRRRYGHDFCRRFCFPRTVATSLFDATPLVQARAEIIAMGEASSPKVVVSLRQSRGGGLARGLCRTGTSILPARPPVARGA